MVRYFHASWRNAMWRNVTYLLLENLATWSLLSNRPGSRDVWLSNRARCQNCSRWWKIENGSSSSTSYDQPVCICCRVSPGTRQTTSNRKQLAVRGFFDLNSFPFLFVFVCGRFLNEPWPILLSSVPRCLKLCFLKDSFLQCYNLCTHGASVYCTVDVRR